jgi:hypothetical protein
MRGGAGYRQGVNLAMSAKIRESHEPLDGMRAVCVTGLILVVLIAGCGGVKPAPPGEPAKSAPQGAAVAPVAPTPPTPPVPPPPPVAAQGTPAAAAPLTRPTAPPPPAAPESVAKAGAPAAKVAPKAPTAAAQAPKKDAAPAETAKAQAPPPLDLTSLETRLKETKAIGVLTKIALKNQVDDLLNQFRAYYKGTLKTTLAELRRPYDLLVLKVLSLLQDSDPTLASAIVASREAIWGILSDPVKFATV